MTFRTVHRSRVLSVSGVLVGLWMFLSGAFGQVAFAAKTDLVRAKKAGGGESSLFEKLVVVSPKALLAKTPGGEGQFVSPYSVYFRMKTADGTNQKGGCYRVGDSNGNPAGWIKIEHVRSWSTRFVIEPLEPRPNRVFMITDENGVDVGKRNSGIVPGGTRRFAFITGKPQKKDGKENDSGPFPVVVCVQQVKSTADGQDLTAELNTIQDLKLEVVFVTESTDFMLHDFDGVTVKQSVQNMMKQVVNAAANDPILSRKKSVRFGWAEYQDCNNRNADGEGPSYISRMTQPLTDNYAEFLGRIDAFKPEAIAGDWPEDALSGLNTALDDAGWEKNSTKHVILIAAGNMHHHRYGSGPNQIGSSNNALTRHFDRTDTTAEDYKVIFGQNSSGVSLDQLLSKASPEGGSVEVKARNSRRFHAVLAGKPIPPNLLNNQELMKAVDGLLALSDDALRAASMKDPKFMEYFVGAGRIKLITLCKERARRDYLKLTDNRGNQGLFLEMAPNKNSVAETAQALESELRHALAAMSRILKGDLSTAGLGDGAISQSLYILVGAAATKFKDQPVIPGYASIRDKRGRQVAQKKVMISQQELLRLKSILDALFRTFKQKTAKVQRSDVTKILNDLKDAIAKTGAGQKELAADVKLKDLISDLPLRTTALDTSAGDIAVMSSDSFKQWLNKLEAAIFKVEELLEEGNWLYLSKTATNDKFTFLHVSELP